MKTAEELLSEISKWNIASVKQPAMQKQLTISFSTALKAMEEYAQQNTLNRDKVMEVFEDHFYPQDDDQYAQREYERASNSALKAICSLTVPALNEGEIEKIIGKYARRFCWGFDANIIAQDSTKAIIKELTTPDVQRD